ncbi:TIGR02147 family protein [Bdellovibrio sp. HCB337]|uniref:TIGR02147 family protein n=1 Tax=Bdellovibrio sp. HCB337 TaxID=3394358 RepID=UPI0039A4FC6A
MDVFAESNYKEILKLRLKELKTRRRSLSFKKVADYLGVQATYLSKILNQDSHHLAEDDLYSTCRLLEFLGEETDYILLLRTHAVCTRAERKKELAAKIDRLKNERKLNADSQQLQSSAITNQMEYLFTPHLLIFHVALMSDTLRKDPRGIGARLGLKVPEVRELLKKLERMELVKLDPEDAFEILEVEKWRTHFHKDHPLMRVGQNLLRQVAQTRLQTTPESEKHSMNFTFTMDANGFDDLKKEFQVFLKKAEEISRKSRHSEVYQLNFDLFRWV